MKQRFIGFIAIILTIAAAVIFGQNDASNEGCCASFESVTNMTLCELRKCYIDTINCGGGTPRDAFDFCYKAMFTAIKPADCCQDSLRKAVVDGICQNVCGPSADPVVCCKCLANDKNAILFMRCLQCSVKNSTCAAPSSSTCPTDPCCPPT